MELEELEPYAHYTHGPVKLCDVHDMQNAQTKTHELNVWVVILMSTLWMILLIWGAELLKSCGGVHEHGHGGHSDHDHGEKDHDHEEEGGKHH